MRGPRRRQPQWAELETDAPTAFEAAERVEFWWVQLVEAVQTGGDPEVIAAMAKYGRAVLERERFRRKLDEFRQTQ